jgi:hypothetical protein
MLYTVEISSHVLLEDLTESLMSSHGFRRKRTGADVFSTLVYEGDFRFERHELEDMIANKIRKGTHHEVRVTAIPQPPVA